MKKKVPAKPAPRAAKKRNVAARVLTKLVETPAPYLEVAVRERLTEASLVRVFEEVRVVVMRYRPKRVFIDLRQSAIVLTISDLNGLAKLVAGTFAGVVDRLALLLRPQDILAEKFFEPSVSSRGLPTLVTADLNDAIDWLTAKRKLVR